MAIQVQMDSRRILDISGPIVSDSEFLAIGRPLSGEEYLGITEVQEIVIPNQFNIAEQISLWTTEIKNIQSTLVRNELRTMPFRAVAVQDVATAAENVLNRPGYNDLVTAALLNTKNKFNSDLVDAKAADGGTIGTSSSTSVEIAQLLTQKITAQRALLRSASTPVSIWFPFNIFSALNSPMVSNGLMNRPLEILSAIGNLFIYPHFRDNSTIYTMLEEYVGVTANSAPYMEGEETVFRKLHRYFYFSVPAILLFKEDITNAIQKYTVANVSPTKASIEPVGKIIEPIGQKSSSSSSK